MNGIALLMIAATLGVEYDWQTTDDGQIEYVLIVEPDFIPALAEGSEIRSSVPNELESVQRLCIRIAQPAKNGVAPQQTKSRQLPGDAFRSSRVGLRAEPVTILWKALGQPEETTLVRYGWQPTKEGQQEYFVQIDPKLLRTLAPGDEIYATLSAEAGRTDTFVVFSNTKQLPKVPGKPGIAPLPANNFAGNSPSGNLAGTTPTNPPAGAPFAPPAFTAPGTFTPPAPVPAAPTTFGPPAAPALNPGFTTSGFNSPATTTNDKAPLYSPPRKFGVTDDPVASRDYADPNGSRVNPATGYGPAQPAATDHVRGYQYDNTRPDPTRPPLNPGVSPTGLNSSGLNSGGLNPPANQPFRNDGYGATGYNANGQPALNPPANDLYPNNNSYPNPNTFANNPNGNLRPNGPQLPSAGNAPYRPGVNGYPQDNNLANQGFNNQGFNGPNSQNSQAVGYGPMNDNQMAALPNNPNTLRPGLRDDLNKNGLAAANLVPQEKPWWPMVFVSFFLFVSLGANLYLVWTAMEFYSRYRLAVERLRTSGSR